MLLTCKRIYFCIYRWKFCNLCIKEIIGIKNILLISPWFALIYQNSFSYIITLNIFPARKPHQTSEMGVCLCSFSLIHSHLFRPYQWHISPTSLQKAPKLGELFGGVLWTWREEELGIYLYREPGSDPCNKAPDGWGESWGIHTSTWGTALLPKNAVTS